MKRSFASLFFGLLLCLCGSVLVALTTGRGQVLAQTPPAMQATTLAVLNVRSGPSTSFAVLGQLAVGATVPVTGRTPEGQERWWQIVYPAGSGQRAWIIGRDDLVQVSNPGLVAVVTALPVAPEPLATSSIPAPQLTPLLQISNAELRVTRFSPDGAQLATASGNHTSFGVKLRRTADGALVRDFTQYSGIVWDVAFSPDGQWLASAADDQQGQSLRVWRLRDGAPVTLVGLPTGKHSFYAVAFSPDGRFLAASGYAQAGSSKSLNGAIWLLDTSNWQLRQVLSAFGQNSTLLAFTPDSRLLVTDGVPDGVVRIWQLSDWRLLRSFTAGRLGGRGVAVAPDGTLLATAFCDESGTYGCLKGGVTITRMSDGAVLQRFADVAESVAFSPDGRYLVTGAGANDAKLRIRSTVDWALLNSLSRRSYVVAFSQDGRYLVANDFDRLQLWAFNAGAMTPDNSGAAPQILTFTVTPTTTRTLGESIKVAWTTTGDRAELCRLVITQLNCEPIAGTGQKSIVADQSLLGVSAFVLQSYRGERKVQQAVSIQQQCQNRFAWFFANPPVACPADAALVSPAAYQRFEHGLMLWVDHGPGQADDEFYVFFDESHLRSDRPRTYITLLAPFQQKAGASPDNRTGETPPAGLFEPVSGFGMLWRDEFVTDPFYFRDLRARLGWALAPEAGYEFAKQCEASAFPTCYLRLPGDRVLRTYPDSTAGVNQLWEEWRGR
ncbi:MAG: hypothetical protein DYG89_09580 [Caldilinea sp. CFX5]|nr:hypothetical protein [Caldilinea sp. CFX5]